MATRTKVAWLSWCPCNNHNLLVRLQTQSWWCNLPRLNSTNNRLWWWSNLKSRITKPCKWLDHLEMLLQRMATSTVAIRPAIHTATALRKSRCRWLKLSTTEVQPCSVVREPALRMVKDVKWSAAFKTRMTTWTSGSDLRTQLLQLHLQLRIYEELIMHQPLLPLMTKVTDSK